MRITHKKGIEKRKIQIRSRILGKSDRPRLVVQRSNMKIYAQIIDDQKAKTLVSVHEKELGMKIDEKMTKVEKAKKLGVLIGEKAVKAKIKKVVFDRSGYHYHGRVKALAEGAREAGLII